MSVFDDCHKAKNHSSHDKRTIKMMDKGEKQTICDGLDNISQLTKPTYSN